MSRYLIIYAHPSHDGHNGYLLKKLTEKFTTNHINFEVLDLYQLKWDPILKNEELYSSGRKSVSPETKIMQTKIKEAERLIFIYPTWWQSLPAILKGFFDRVFVSGFGFVYKNGIPVGLLKNKRAAVFTTMSGPVFFFYLIGLSSLRLVTRHILFLCGIKNRGFFLANARNLEDNKARLDSISNKIYSYLTN